jgi:putative endonuclease
LDGAPEKMVSGIPIAIRRGAMRMSRQELGILGENLAVEELTRRGYAILERRYRTRYGEIDIVTEDAGVLVFVEVKAREDLRFGTAADAVTPEKQRKVASRAVEYLARKHVTDRACRFDVVAIDFAGTPRQTITVYTHAFEATS